MLVVHLEFCEVRLAQVLLIMQWIDSLVLAWGVKISILNVHPKCFWVANQHPTLRTTQRQIALYSLWLCVDSH